jgi:hypothetical protein
MLSWSSHDVGAEIDLTAVAAGHGDAGVPLGGELIRFASAAARLSGDTAELDDARRAVVSRAGEAGMIDAAAVAANFHMMTRLADATGARLPTERLTRAQLAIEQMGATNMASRR